LFLSRILLSVLLTVLSKLSSLSNLNHSATVNGPGYGFLSFVFGMVWFLPVTVGGLVAPGHDEIVRKN